MEILHPILQKLHNEANVRKEKKLEQLTKLAIEDLEQVQQRRIGGVSLPPPPSAMGDEDEEDATDSIQVQDTVSPDFIGDRYYKCYKLGCQPWMPSKIQQVSLDAIHKLTAHNLLSGGESWEFPKGDSSKIKEHISIPLSIKNGLSPFDSQFKCSESNDLSQFDRLWPTTAIEPIAQGKSRVGNIDYQLIDDLITTICTCYTGPKTDEGIQLQVAKVLLTLFASPSVKIHSVTLLKMLQTLINISVYTPKPILQATSKATLTQAVNLVVSRMEECNQRLKNFVNEEQNGKLNGEEGTFNEDQEDGCLKPESIDDVDSKPKSPISLQVKQHSQNSGYNAIETLLKKREQLEEDSLLVLQLLCHLSLGFEVATLSDQESTLQADSRSRAITLELILSMLNNSGRLFQTDARFSQVLKRNLCVSLSRNGISTDPVVFELSLSIFIVLFSSFRASLKSEIEVLFKEIYLRLINMSSSTYYQKSLILQALMKICRSPQAIVDMYVNYDCNLGSASIFENMMDLLSKIAQGRQSKPTPNQNSLKSSIFNSDSNLDNDIVEDKWLKVRGLRCLVTVVNSLVEWSKGVNKNETRVNTPRDVNTPNESIEGGGLPIVVNKNHLEHSGNFSTFTAPSHPSVLDSNEEVDDPEKIQKNSTKKQVWVQCIHSFNQSPKRGLIELQNHGLVGTDPFSVASFFLSVHELSKQAVGNYLGRPESECVKVMHAFVDQFDFSNKPFVSALRSFLQAFRLPRESQQIDRILEKFADRYCETNPDAFESADTAYVLAFSVMMLNTDQHSSQVRNRMDFPMFIKNNKGINNGKDLDESFLLSVFEDIANCEIVMEEEHFNTDNEKDPKERLIRYHQEAAFLQKKLLSLFQGTDPHTMNSMFLSATHTDHVKPMFAIAWYPIIAAFSRIFEEIVDVHDPNTPDGGLAKESVQLCVEGFSGAIHISSMYFMEIERNAFISSLIKFTSINKVEALRPKHIACIQSLINIGYMYGEYLDESWELVLEAISRMEQLHLFNDQSDQPVAAAPPNASDRLRSESRKSLTMDGRVQSSPRRVTGAPLSLAQDLNLLNQLRSQPNIGEQLNGLRSQETLVKVDKIFNNSVAFSGMSIVHFYRAICNVSLQEVEETYPGRPRTFSLQKIVEITYYNMTRIRLEWTPIWKILRPYFNTVGCHEDQSVAALAVDSLRQLSMKFVDREELSHFNTQHEFLKPFEHIARHNHTPGMQDLVLQSLAQMINSRAANIKSGWKSVFTVLSYLSNYQPTLSILSTSFKLARNVFEDHFDLLGSAFTDGINCMVAFGINKVSKDIANEAIQLMFQSIEPFLNDNITNNTDSSADQGNEVESSHYDPLYYKWFPVLSGFSRVVIDAHYEALREDALNLLFDTLRKSGNKFNPEFWNTVLRSILIPIFDDIKGNTDKKGRNSDNWFKAMSLLINLFEEFYSELSGNIEFVEKLFQLITGMLLHHRNDNLTKHALNLFKAIVVDNHTKFDVTMWDLVTRSLHDLFQVSTPNALFTILPQHTPTLQPVVAEGVEELKIDDVEMDQIENNTITEVELEESIQLSNGNHQLEEPVQEQAEDAIYPSPSELESEEVKAVEVATPTTPLTPVTPTTFIVPPATSTASTLPTASLHDVDIPSELFKCSIHLSLLQTMKDILTYHSESSDFDAKPILLSLPNYTCRKWLMLLLESAQFAKRFNDSDDLRNYLWTQGYVNQLPHLIRQESSARSTYLQVAFQLYARFGDAYDLNHNFNGVQEEEGDSTLVIKSTPLFFEVADECFYVLDKFIHLINLQPQPPKREVGNWAHLVTQILKGFSNIDWGNIDADTDSEGKVKYQHLTQKLPEFYKRVVQTIVTDRIDVHKESINFFNKVGTYVFK